MSTDTVLSPYNHLNLCRPRTFHNHIPSYETREENTKDVHSAITVIFMRFHTYWDTHTRLRHSRLHYLICISPPFVSIQTKDIGSKSHTKSLKIIQHCYISDTIPHA
jgi:hypothetical protein